MSSDPSAVSSGKPPINQQLLRAAIKLNTWLLALVFGSAGGLLLFLVTYMSLYRGLPQPGQYLNLLGVFLPGYSVSHAGAWAGLFWGAVIGAVVAVIFYRIYARSIESQVQEHIYEDRKDSDLLGITLRLDGNYLGLALGAMVAAGLLVTTNWLVFRGTAAESMHAILLANYLPGYTVSFSGGLIGALELFAFVYLVCQLFSWLYNSIASLRGRQAP
jgi:hypothetical protein